MKSCVHDRGKVNNYFNSNNLPRMLNLSISTHCTLFCQPRRDWIDVNNQDMR